MSNCVLYADGADLWFQCNEGPKRSDWWEIWRAISDGVFSNMRVALVQWNAGDLMIAQSCRDWPERVISAVPGHGTVRCPQSHGV